MPPLNPYLAAFFKSIVAAQCRPAIHHVLLIPTTDFFLSHRELDVAPSTTLADTVSSEEFLSNHVLRIIDPPSQNGEGAGAPKDGTLNLREMRGKAKQYMTVGGRGVIIKDNIVYTNKGFKTLASANILGDAIWYSDTVDSKPWLIYYISRPLLSSWEEIKIRPAHLPGQSHQGASSPGQYVTKRPTIQAESSESRILPRKKDIKSFHDLLNHFPIISRQMHLGLEKLFKEFTAVIERPLPPPPSASHIPDPVPDGAIAAAMRRARTSSTANRSPSRSSGGSCNAMTEPFYAEDDEEVMRASLETAVTSAIDLFQGVDKQQLSLLGATTDLTGPLVERLIERYVTEMVHNLVFPRLCALKRHEDLDLEAKIRHMEFVDVSQLGITIDGGRAGKQELINRLGRAVEVFRKIASSTCPSKSMDILLDTLKAVTHSEDAAILGQYAAGRPAEKAPLTINADTLVSLLLYVVIRAQIKHLHARFAYIRHFMFLDDVDSGELGYALSTFEAVLSYLDQDSASLRRASRRNKSLWDSAASGELARLKEMMEGVSDNEDDDEEADHIPSQKHSRRTSSMSSRWSRTNGSRHSLGTLSSSERFSMGSDLSHVFPFNKAEESDRFSMPAIKRVKRVAIDVRSMSSNSDISFRSRATSVGTYGSGLEGDTSIERLSQTQNSFGESLLMMAVQNERPEILEYLLSLQGYYPPETVLEDSNNEATTLLSAAIQLGHDKLIKILLDYMKCSSVIGILRMKDYFAVQDIWGRSVGHYCFHSPWLMTAFGHIIPWRQRDKNGQTPLFAICRCYDHPLYSQMAREAIEVTTISQGDQRPLHLDDHIDNKSNTLLHIITDPALCIDILRAADADVNAANDRKFTPLMVASKYGRLDMIPVFYNDKRVDLYAREARGLTAVELAKDDEARNKIDDLNLFATPVGPVHRRTTAVVRGYLVEDASVRFVIKSGAPMDRQMYAITTCRRSLGEFEHLSRLLSLENPASWIPSLTGSRSPFQIPAKPSRAVLRELQTRLDWWLRVMLGHTTFATHEMLWEFFLVPDLQTEMMDQRSQLKAKARAERVRDELQPLEDACEVEQFVDYARDTVRSVNHSTKSVARRAAAMANKATDLYDAAVMIARATATMEYLPPQHIAAMASYVQTLQPMGSTPLTTFHSSILALQSTIDAVLTALARPPRLLAQMQTAKRSMERTYNSLSRSTRWPLGLLDDARQRMNEEREEKVRVNQAESDDLSRELRATQTVVASELAGWQDMHERMGRRAIRELARGMVTMERARLDGMRRVLRRLRFEEGMKKGDGEGVARWNGGGPVVPVKDDHLVPDVNGVGT